MLLQSPIFSIGLLGGWNGMRRPCAVVLTILAAVACACSPRPSPDATEPAGSRPDAANPVTVPTGVGAGDEWTTSAGDPANTRFSRLDEITRDNVSRLRVAWTFSTGVLGGHEAAPLVVGNTMYLVTPFPNIVFALDLTQPGAPVKWQYDARTVSAARGVACCDVVNRGVAWWNGTIVFNTLDNRTISLDATTGAQRWEATLGDINRGETMTMAPLVAGDLVLVGNSGGEFGVRGWLTALDAATGAQRWRAWSTGPDADVLIGPDFTPFYATDRGRDLGVTTWPPEAWRTGGGTAWGWVSYDPALNLIYYGTGNPGPWNPEQRPGDNKWTAGVFARDAVTGAARWFYQWSPHDLYDHDGVNENVLIDYDGANGLDKVLVHAERNGYIYVLDRVTGRVHSATPFVHITASTGVDTQSGRLLTVKEKEPREGVVIRDICPAAPGAKDWQPMSFSPRTGLMYIPHNNLCMDFEGVEVSYIEGTPYLGANVVYHAGPGGHQGEVTAWDPVGRRAVWKLTEPFPAWSATLATAGDVVFYGTLEGWFKAVDARTGDLLWQFKTGSGIVGQPISYRGPDGHQYVAVFSGVGGWPGSVVVNDLDTRDATAAAGWGGAMRNLRSVTARGGTLYVFRLEGP
jgi:PQQ-dependent dehydrogenase (methanol/ethanol family)